MPHRDPETGQFVGGDGGAQSMSYSDHDVHHVLHEVRGIGGETGPDFLNEQQYEITQRGLDPDELAELRAVRVAIGTVFAADQPQDSIGSSRIQIGAGYNLSGDEFIQAAPDGENFDVDGDGDNDFLVLTDDTDEVGQFYSYSDTLVAPYDDDANGNGGGGYNTSNTEMLNMGRLFGQGPYVDAVDDFTSRIRVTETNQIATLGVKVVYSLYYNVEEVESGRSRFGR